MDMKASAKSKRAHSLHHSKKHNPHQASKASPISSGDKKPTGKQSKEKPLHSHESRPLPSNWDRYNEDFDLGSDVTSQASSSHPTEFVAPKSRGADYSHLISEAKAQAHANYPSDVFLDDLNFTQDFGPILAAKGQNIFSWIADDCFEFESKASSTLEVPFLSLNLNALTEQLARAKLSERLFLEPDLLPLDLLDDELREACSEEHDPNACASVPIEDSGASVLGLNLEGRKNVQQYKESLLSTVTPTENFVVQTSEELKSVKQVKDEIFQSHGMDRSISTKQVKDEILQSEGSHSNISSNSIYKNTVDSAPANRRAFEAASAEAELDMLLNSFSETKVFESLNTSSAEISSIPSSSAACVQKGKHIMKPAMVPTNIGDAIDSLLQETPDLTQVDDSRLPQAAKVASDDVSSSIDPNSKSELLDDFDSWLDTI